MAIYTDLLVIGGGAAGFFTAINCVENNPKAKVIIVEQGKKVLNKVKISGGGRCNVTHACFIPKDLAKFYPRGEKALLGPFHQFCTGDTMEWFEKKGVDLKIEADNRVFPVSNDSQSIINCLLTATRKLGIQIHLQTKITNITPPTPNQENSLWKVQGKQTAYKAKKLLIATGSSPAMWKIISQLNHPIIPPVPSLFTFNIKDIRLKELAGISVPNSSVKVVGEKLQETGPLLITHWGLSGPGVLKLSAWGARKLQAIQYQFQIQVNWIYPNSYQEVVTHLLAQKEVLNKKRVATLPQFNLPARLWKKLVLAADISLEKRWAEVGKKALQKLAKELTQASFAVKGKSTFKEEFVTAGGVELTSVNFKTFESKLHKGLFFAGEVLNIDAVTGGFNFQAAWTGGFIAAKAIASDIR